MFGRSRSDSFSLYGKRRSRWRLPGWLLWWLFGAIAGAAAVVYVQERHLPPRLSAGETAQLRAAFAEADAERTRLRQADAERQRLAEELKASQAARTRQAEELRLAVDALPPAPRGGLVEVRAAQFDARGGELHYQLVLTRAGASTPLSAVLKFTVAGVSSSGGAANAALPPLPVSIGRQAIVRGSVPLPDGVQARQTTVQVLDKPDGRQLGMRVLLVQ